MFAVEKLDPAIASITATQIRSFEGEALTIPLVDCQVLDGRDIPTYDDLMKLQSSFKRGLLCPDTDMLELSGTPETLNHSYIEIAIRGCTLAPDECKTSDGWNNPIDNIPFRLVTTKSHVDFYEKVYNEQPISYSLDTSNRIQLNSNVIQTMTLFYTESKVIFDDYFLKKWLPPPEESIFELNSRLSSIEIPNSRESPQD